MRLGLTVAAVLALVAGCASAPGAKHDGAGPDAGPAIADAGVTDLPPIPTDGYTTTVDGIGGYQLGPKLSPSVTTIPAPSSTGCQTLQGIVRDFKGALPAWGGSLQPGGHPDFEVFEGREITPGLVEPVLGGDQKPKYASQCELGAPVSGTCPYGAMTTSEANFDQWYHSAPGVNITYVVYFQLVTKQNVSTFSSNDFFPLDGQGWGNSGTDSTFKIPHNYSFTTEIHTKFRYNGGESFTFLGDDDVWIFINGKLAVDLGGLHFSEMGTVDLDAQAATLGIQKGSVYALDLFNAERHSVNSDFRIDVTFPFENCGQIVP